MSESEDWSSPGLRGPVAHFNGVAGSAAHPKNAPMNAVKPVPQMVTFDRRELGIILRAYGYRVADGEWRDYAIDHLDDRAVFSIFRRSSECPIYRIEKIPALARKQGQYQVIAASGAILKRGRDLAVALRVLDKPKLRLVSG